MGLAGTDQEYLQQLDRMISTASSERRQRLATYVRRYMSPLLVDELFEHGELEALCTDIEQDLSDIGIALQVDLEIVGGTTETVQVLRLIEHLDKRGYLDYMVRAVR